MSTATRRPSGSSEKPSGAKPGKGSGYRPRTAADHLPRSQEQERSVGKGLAALLGMLVLVVGIPVGLVLLVGNPLPSSLPTTEWLTAPVTAEALINIVAVLVWLVWAHFVVCLIAEWRALRAGRLPGLVPAGGGSQLVARRLIAGVLLLAGTATMTGNAPGPAAAPEAAVVSTADVGAAPEAGSAGGAALGTADGERTSTSETGGEAFEATPAATQGEAKVTKFYEVKPPQGRNYDTLWDIAERTTGDPFRYKELYQLNQDRVQPDGRRLVDADLIRPGWQLVMPADASGPDITVVRAHVPSTSVPTEVVADTLEGAGERASALADGAARSAADAAQGAAEAAPTGSVAQGGGTAAVTGQTEQTPSGSEVDLGELALGGGMVLAGLALALSSRRGPYGDPTQQEQALRLAADTGRADLLDRALRLLAEGRRAQGQALPDASAVYVNDEQVIVHLAGSGTAGLPPTPWRETEEGRVWVLRAEDALGHSCEGPAPWPALVNIGMSHGFDLLVDLEYAPGLVSISGDPQGARDAALSSVVDLVTHPWSDGVRVTLVGFAGDEALAEVSAGRITQVRSLDEALATARRDVDTQAALVRSLGVDGVLAGRVAGAGSDLQPHVIVMSGSPDQDEAQRITALLSGGRTGLAVVCVGQTLAARWRFAVDGGGALDLGVLGLSGTARRLRHEDLELVAGWVRAAGTQGAEATAQAAVLSPGAAVQTLPQEGREHLAAAAAMQARDEAQAHVGLLGPVVVHAPGQVNPSREELLTELVTLVALHPSGVHDSVLRVSLWPRGVEDDVVEATLASAIQWLGDGTDGTPLLDRDDAGRWRLGAGVHVDWLELAAVAQAREDDPRRLADALGAARGRAFSGTPAQRYTWLAFHQAARDARLVVTASARRAASAFASQDDVRAAERTLRDGLTLVPQAQSLWRDLLRLLGGSDPEGAGRVVREMTQAIGSDPLEPETSALVQHLSPDMRELG